MNTKQAEYKTDIAQLAAQGAQRETRIILAVFGAVFAAVAMATAILGFLIRLPAPPAV